MKYAHMSGSVGCLSDNNTGPFDTEREAIESACFMFEDAGPEDYCDTVEDITLELLNNSIFYFPDEWEAGADYVEVYTISDEEAAEWLREDY